MTFGMLSICKIPSCLTANNYYHCYLYYCFYSNYYCITSSTTITTTTTPTTSTTTATAPDHLILFEKRKNLHIWPNHLQISCFVKIVLFYCFGFTLKLEFNSEYHILEHKLSKQMLFSGRRKKKLKVTTIHWLCHNRIHPVLFTVMSVDMSGGLSYHCSCALHCLPVLPSVNESWFIRPIIQQGFDWQNLYSCVLLIAACLSLFTCSYITCQGIFVGWRKKSESVTPV